MKKYLALSYAAIALTLSTASYAAKLNGLTLRPSGVRSAASVEPSAAPLGLIGTLAGGASNFTTVGSSQQPIDTSKAIACPGPKTCRVEANIYAVLGEGNTNSNSYYLCATLDGSPFNIPSSNCLAAGTVPSDGTATSANVLQLQGNVRPGRHSVQSFASTRSGPATLVGYTVEYRIYTQQ